MDKEQRAGAVYCWPVIVSGFVAKWPRIREMKGSAKPSTIFLNSIQNLSQSLKFNKSIILSDIFTTAEPHLAACLY